MVGMPAAQGRKGPTHNVLHDSDGRVVGLVAATGHAVVAAAAQPMRGVGVVGRGRVAARGVAAPAAAAAATAGAIGARRAGNRGIGRAGDAGGTRGQGRGI